MKTYNIEVQPKLKKLLRERGLTQTEFARMTGIDQATISRFDSNTQHLDKHVVIIASCLQVKIEDLFEVVNF